MNIRERALYPIDGNGKLTIEDIVIEASGGGDGESTTVDTLTGATTTGKALMKAASQEAARAAIGAGTSDFSGSYSDLSNKPAIPAAATVDNLGGAGETGKELMQADNSTAARAAIGAGTGNSNLAIGTTADTAKAGNYQPTWAQVTSKPAVIGAGATAEAARQAIGAASTEDIPEVPATPTWSTLSGKPAVIAAGATAEAARQAIGAGTSNLEIGTTATTAMAGNTPIPDAATWANLSGKPATFPPTIGTTASTAKAGNYTPTIAEVTGLQAALDAKATSAALADLVARVEALEGAG